jgi:hypothetical protein
MSLARVLKCVSFALLFFTPVSTVFANWTPDGRAVSTAVNDQTLPLLTSDGAGGAIIAWRDGRSGTLDVYAQRVDARGNPLWTSDGVAICTATGLQYVSVVVSDGLGGAIIVWRDHRSGATDIYAQRVNGSGVPLWTPDGVPICTATGSQGNPSLLSDGAGGAYLAWEDNRLGETPDIYVQRVNASGIAQWTADGVLLSTTSWYQLKPDIATDGAGGAIVTWYDFRSVSTYDIYARRVNASGVPQWTANGVAICTAAGDQIDPKIVSDGAGGAIITWYDERNPGYDIYAQRVDASGVPLWTPDGVGVCTAANSQNYPQIVTDGVGGAIVAWQDYRTGTKWDVYAQRLNALGVTQWTPDGEAIRAATNNAYYPAVASDGSGGAIITWRDDRNTNYDIYAQRVDGAGGTLWTPDGLAVCVQASNQYNPAVASVGACASAGAVVAWAEYRNGTADVYAQRLGLNYGYWGHPEPTIASVEDVPLDQGGNVVVSWDASGWDVFNLQTITHYSVWRAMDAVSMSARAALVEPGQVGEDFSGPAWRVEHTDAGDYYWEWVGNQSAYYFAGYTHTTPTWYDSTDADPAQHYFQVLAHTWDDFVFWASCPDSGRSVDNVAPAAPLSLAAARTGGNSVDLEWSPSGHEEPDFNQYEVYRGHVPGFPTDPTHFLMVSADTAATDGSAVPTQAFYYRVLATDIHGNKSEDSNEAWVNIATGVGDPAPPIASLTVLPNSPNPFGASTEIRFGLPAAADVALRVFDVAGRQVYSRLYPGQAEGWQRLVFEGRDNSGRLLPSGVYFYRLSALGTTQQRKLVISR